MSRHHRKLLRRLRAEWIVPDYPPRLRRCDGQWHVVFDAWRTLRPVTNAGEAEATLPVEAESVTAGERPGGGIAADHPASGHWQPRNVPPAQIRNPSRPRAQ